MSDTGNEYIVRYMTGRSAFNSAIESPLSNSQRIEKLEEAAYYFEKALEFAPDDESKMDCHRLLGAVLFTQNFHLQNFNILDVAKSGLSSFSGLSKAITEQEEALRFDAHLEEKFFSDRGIASEVLLRLDILWSYDSFYISQHVGALQAANYLEGKLKLLDYLGGVDLPATCFALYLHYTNEEVGSSELYFFKALNWLRRAAQGEAYENIAQGDIAHGSMFGSMALNAKRKAQEQLRQLGG